MMRKVVGMMLIIGIFLTGGVQNAETQSEKIVSEEIQSEEIQSEEIQSDGIQRQDRLRQKLYAKSAVLMDADSGRTLFGKEEGVPRPMASTTKILTCILALEIGSPDMVITASSKAASQPKVHLGVRTGDQYYLKDLLFSLMLESHNDSAVMIAEGIAGSVEGFAELMNQKARDIGCKDSFFITPNGLDSEMTDQAGEKHIHQTTAEDLARIMRYCICISPKKEKFLEIVQTQNYYITDIDGDHGRSCGNHNALLTMLPGTLAGKTGFTGDAGYCYVGAAEREGKTLIVALLACGWPNHKNWKWQDTRRMMEYGWENYEFFSFCQVQVDMEKLKPLRVENGEPEKLGQEVYVPLEVAEIREPDRHKKLRDGLLLEKSEHVTLKYMIPEVLHAPIHKGECIGSVQYLLGGTVWKEVPVAASADISGISILWCIKITINSFVL